VDIHRYREISIDREISVDEEKKKIEEEMRKEGKKATLSTAIPYFPLCGPFFNIAAGTADPRHF
jgi:hypothetical protein